MLLKNAVEYYKTLTSKDDVVKIARLDTSKSLDLLEKEGLATGRAVSFIYIYHDGQFFRHDAT